MLMNEEIVLGRHISSSRIEADHANGSGSP